MDFALKNVIVAVEIVFGTALALGILWLSVTKGPNQTVSTGGGRAPRALKYHPIHVAAHWFVVFAMAQLLTRGALIMSHVPNSSPAKIDALLAHSLAGISVAAVMVLRLILLRTTGLPKEVKGPTPGLDLLKRIVHPMFYVSIFVQVFAGLGMAIQSDLPRLFFLHEGSLPQTFWIYPLRSVHYINSRLLIVLIALHLAGALYHTFVMKDGLLRRMSFGRRRDCGSEARQWASAAKPP
ncbi:MAG TPA: cytochrome b/b6 domain-containing protein [Stellaceae bacterium]|nr:cytochrome b/b6 domain-containing protein [Stellaceae bacterium]